MKPAIIGQIGCGAWGKNILRDLVSLGCSVVVADPSPTARETAAELGATQVVNTSDEIAAFPCDGYVVASPILTLADEAEKVLRLGRPVFCEKPVLLTDKEGERLATAGAVERLFAMYKFCYHPGIEALRAIVAAGELGPLESISLSRMGWDVNVQGTNCLWLAAVHQISIVHRLLGQIPEPRSAVLAYHGGVAVTASVSLGLEVPILINVSCRHPVKSISAALYFAGGVALLAGAYSKSITIKKNPGTPEERIIDSKLPLLSELEEFVGYLRGGRAPRCSFDMARSISKTIRKIEALASPGRI